MSFRSHDYRSRNDARYNRTSRWSSNSSHDHSSSRSHYSHPRPSSSRYHESSDSNNHHSRSSIRTSKDTSYKDKPFTIVKPPEKLFTTVKPDTKSLTAIKPDESRGFSVITNQDNDFDQFTDSSRTPPKHRDIYSQLSLKQSNYFIFGSKTSSDVLKMSFLYAVARMIYEGETDETMIPAIAAAEFAADYLPTSRQLFGSQADAYFEQVMAKAVRNPNFVLKVQPNEDLYTTLEEYDLPRVYPTQKPEKLNGEQYMHILQILSTSLDPAYINCDLVIALTAITPCLLLNNVTLEFLCRLQKTVLDELQKEITLEIKSTNIFFEQYLKEASEQEVDEMLIYWRRAIPDTAEKLKSDLKRLPGNGLQPIIVIGRALTLCDDFPWDKTLEFYREDWKALNKAMLLIDLDPFYGFRRDKDEIVNPCHYQNLAWLGKQLCIAKLEDNNLNNLQVEEPNHAKEIKKIVEIYVAHSQRESQSMDER